MDNKNWLELFKEFNKLCGEWMNVFDYVNTSSLQEEKGKKHSDYLHLREEFKNGELVERTHVEYKNGEKIKDEHFRVNEVDNKEKVFDNKLVNQCGKEKHECKCKKNEEIVASLKQRVSELEGEVETMVKQNKEMRELNLLYLQTLKEQNDKIEELANKLSVYKEFEEKFSIVKK